MACDRGRLERSWRSHLPATTVGTQKEPCIQMHAAVQPKASARWSTCRWKPADAVRSERTHSEHRKALNSTTALISTEKHSEH